MRRVDPRRAVGGFARLVDSAGGRVALRFELSQAPVSRATVRQAHGQEGSSRVQMEKRLVEIDLVEMELVEMNKG